MENAEITFLVIGVIIGLIVLIIALIIILLPRGFQTFGQNAVESSLLNHVVVTGGSSGIGLSVAEELVKQNCKTVTLLARNVAKLDTAKEQLKALAKAIGNTETTIEVYSVDVIDVEAMKKLAKEICDNISAPDIIFNIAGVATSGSFVDTNPNEFERLMQCNFHGTVNVTHSFLPHMLSDNHNHTKTKKPRTIVFTSSAAGQVGIYGYTAYSASKYALRGLAESLQMEMIPENIFVQLVTPPDTDTPGYADDRMGMPEPTRVMCEAGGLFKAEDVAKKMVSSATQRRPTFNVYFGIDGWMLSTLTAGMSPCHSIIDGLYQIFLMGLLRLISLFYLMDFRRIVYKVGNSKDDVIEESKKTN